MHVRETVLSSATRQFKLKGGLLLLETLGHKTARTKHSDLESFHAQANGPCPLRASKVTSTV